MGLKAARAFDFLTPAYTTTSTSLVLHSLSLFDRLDRHGRYANASAADPDKAYTALNTDYGLTCGSASIAVGAKRQGFKSPLYLYASKWGPQAPIPSDGRFKT